MRLCLYCLQGSKKYSQAKRLRWRYVKDNINGNQSNKKNCTLAELANKLILVDADNNKMTENTTGAVFANSKGITAPISSYVDNNNSPPSITRMEVWFPFIQRRIFSLVNKIKINKSAKVDGINTRFLKYCLFQPPPPPNFLT